MWPIIIGYLIIAWQFRGLWMGERSWARIGLGFLIAVFVLCACSGYLPGVISVPVWVQKLTHIVLLGATWAFIISGTAITIEKKLDR